MPRARATVTQGSAPYRLPAEKAERISDHDACVDIIARR